MKWKSIAAVAAALIASGCASAVRGTTENVTINALPEDAAIRTSTGHSCPRSPCTIEVSRKTKLTAYADKPGYKPGQVAIDTKVGGGGAAGFAGNVILGGVIGMGVDAATGATLDHYPNPALIVLEPINPKDPNTPVQVAPPPAAKPAPQSKPSGPAVS